MHFITLAIYILLWPYAYYNLFLILKQEMYRLWRISDTIGLGGSTFDIDMCSYICLRYTYPDLSKSMRMVRCGRIALMIWGFELLCLKSGPTQFDLSKKDVTSKCLHLITMNRRIVS